MPKWTKQEHDYLVANAGVLPIERLRIRLSNKSTEAIYLYALRQGISLKTEINHFSCEQVAKLLKCSPASVIKWIEKGYLSAPRSSERGDYRISIKSLRDFYRRRSDTIIFQKAPKENIAWLLDISEDEMAKYQTMWTDEEEGILLALAESVPVERIAKKLNRSLASVRGKAQLMGLKLTPAVNNLSAQQIADLLNCDRTAIIYWINKKELNAKRSSKKTGQWRISCHSLKRLYENKPNLSIWKKAPRENLEFLMASFR